MKPISAALAIFVISLLQASEPQPIENLFERYMHSETHKLWSVQAGMISPDDLDTLKQSVLAAYATAAEKMKKEKSVSSVAFSTFKSLTELQNLSSKEVYIMIRTAMSPENEESILGPISPVKFISSNTEDGKIVVDYQYTLLTQNQLMEDQATLVYENEKLYFTLWPGLEQLFVNEAVQKYNDG